MTYPSFSVGETLRSADMNAVGRWKIASGTFSGTLLSVSNCFTSDYSNYTLQFDNLFTPNGVRTMCIQLQNASPSTSSYFWAGYYSTFAGGFGAANSTTSGMAYWVPTTAGTYSPCASTIEFYNPAQALKTNIVVSSINFDAGYHIGGYHDVATAYNGFRIFNVSNDTCNFRWALYGNK